MKNLIILLIALVLSTASHAQKCKYDIDKKDTFTGEQTNAIYHKNSGWIWTSMKRGDKLFFEMTFMHIGDIQKPMTTSDTVLVKLADGTVLHLKPSADVLPVNQSKSYTTTSRTTTNRSSASTATIEMTSFSPLFLVDRSVYESISKSGIVAIRLTFTGKPLDLDFTKRPLIKSVDDIMNNAKCILSLN